MLRRTALAVPLVAAIGLLLVGCAPTTGTPVPETSHSSSSPEPTPPATTTPPLSSTELPTLRPPTAPPRTPTDQLPSNVIVGTITTGGKGPCYSMETNDGRPYALYSDAGTVLARGATVRVWFEPVTAKCGAGTPVRIVKVEIVH